VGFARGSVPADGRRASAGRLSEHDVGEFGGFNLQRRVRGVPLRAGDVFPAADDAGGVVFVVEEAGVGGGAGVAHEQRAGGGVGPGLVVQLGGVVHRATRAQPDVAVDVDEPGDHPAAGGDGFGARHRFEGEPPVDDPEVAFLVVGQEDTAHV
jgi:hypothetical protein